MEISVLGPLRLRHGFSAFPQGVVAVAAIVGGSPVGLAVSSFTSVSVSPPLVSLCVAHSSQTWPVLREAPRLAGWCGDRFAELSWHVTEGGAVRLAGAGGWLETSIDRQIRAGDHDIVLLNVHDVDADHAISPVVFHASRFRRLEP
jgi:flavin reductase (DIM6/NTAB) family NADH-FMN oxidoreductase RutF